MHTDEDHQWDGNLNINYVPVDKNINDKFNDLN